MPPTSPPFFRSFKRFCLRHHDLITRRILPRLHPHLRHHATTPPPWRNPLLRLRQHPILFSALSFLTWLPAFPFIWNHIFQIASVTGPSMYPFLNSSHHTSTRKDYVFMTLWNPTSNLQRGMVISFYSPSHPEKMAVKRIVAVEGDRVRTRGGYPFEEEDVPAGHVWVEGDNKDLLQWDSNSYGPVSKSLIVGRVVGVVWPWGRRGWVRWQDWGGCERVREGVNVVERLEFF